MRQLYSKLLDNYKTMIIIAIAQLFTRLVDSFNPIKTQLSNKLLDNYILLVFYVKYFGDII